MARGLEHFARRENAALRFCWRVAISPHRLPEATRRRAFCKAERLCEVHTVAARMQSCQTDRWRRFRNRKISAKSRAPMRRAARGVGGADDGRSRGDDGMAGGV